MIIYFDVFWFQSRSTYCTEHHLGRIFSALPIFLSIRLTCFNKPKISELYRGEQETSFFVIVRFVVVVFVVRLLATVVLSVTAKLIIGLVEPVLLIAANSLSRCIIPDAHMEEIKLAKLMQTPNVFLA